METATTEPTTQTETPPPAHEPAPTPKGDDSGQLVMDLLDGMPAAGKEPTAPPKAKDAPRPERDPATGKPNRRPDGSVRQARGARPKLKEEPTPPPTSPDAPKAVEGTVVEGRDVAALAAATALADTLFAVGSMVGGDEWAWRKEKGTDERETFIKTWQAYFMVAGVPPLPTWAGPAIVTGQYIGSRMQLPRTKAASLTLWGKLKAFVTRLYLRSRGASI